MPDGPRPAAGVTRIGVVADTHVGEYLDALPPSLFEALAGCDLILHAGDISRPWVLDELGRIAPVVAVRGDHDELGDLRLPESTVVTVAGRRIGLIHGRRAFALDMAVIVAHVVARRRLRWRAGLHRSLVRRVGPVDCVVYGHWHEPAHEVVDGTLVFSPGAVCPWGSLEGGRPPGRGFQGVADRWVRRYRTQLGADAMRRSVGVLTVDTDGVHADVIALPEQT
jgi:putative phosphoesterase